MPQQFSLKPPYPRTRRLPLGMVDQWWECWQMNASGTQHYGPNAYKSASSYVQMEDVVVPGYQQLVARGTIVNNPMSKVQVLYQEHGDTGFEAKYNANPSYKWWSAPGWADMSLGFPAPRTALARISDHNLRILAQTAALAGVQAPVNQSLVSLAEFSKTLGMIAQPVKALQQLLQKSQAAYFRGLRAYGNSYNSRLLRHKTHSARHKIATAVRQKVAGQRPPLTQRLEVIPDLVLSYNLGWKPLLMEIDALLHKIPALEQVERRTSRSTKSDKTEWTETIVHPNLSASGQNGTFRYTYTEECIVRAGVLYADGFSVSQHFGTRLVDVPGAVWEIIPFSFLLDYILNVGDYIQALTNVLFNRDMLAYYTTTTIKTSVRREWVSLTMPSGYTLTRLPVGSSTTSYEAKTRSTTSFGAGLAHTPLFDWTYRPPAQLQNALSLLTKFLMGSPTWKAR